MAALAAQADFAAFQPAAPAAMAAQTELGMAAEVVLTGQKDAATALAEAAQAANLAIGE